MAVATTVVYPSPWPGVVFFKYTCDASPSATSLNLGFVPKFAMGWNVTDKDQFWIWSSSMAAGTAMTTTTAAAAVASNGITAIQQTDGTNHGITLGTDAAIQEASKVFEGFAIRG